MMEIDFVTSLSPEILEIAKNELGEDEYLRASSIEAIREWLKKQPHLQTARRGSIITYINYN